MKNLIVLIVAFIFFVSCGASPRERVVSKKPIVTVSIAPQKYFVEQIAGDYFEVNVILPPGSVPEDFEPTPRQVKKIANSEVYFYIGHLGFEKSWIKKFTDSAKGVKYVSCSHNIDLFKNIFNRHRTMITMDGVRMDVGIFNPGRDGICNPKIINSPS